MAMAFSDLFAPQAGAERAAVGEVEIGVLQAVMWVNPLTYAHAAIAGPVLGEAVAVPWGVAMGVSGGAGVEGGRGRSLEFRVD